MRAHTEKGGGREKRRRESRFSSQKNRKNIDWGRVTEILSSLDHYPETGRKRKWVTTQVHGFCLTIIEFVEIKFWHEQTWIGFGGHHRQLFFVEQNDPTTIRRPLITLSWFFVAWGHVLKTEKTGKQNELGSSQKKLKPTDILTPRWCHL